MSADIVASKLPNPTAENVLTARTPTNATNLLKHKKYPATNQPQGICTSCKILKLIFSVNQSGMVLVILTESIAVNDYIEVVFPILDVFFLCFDVVLLFFLEILFFRLILKLSSSAYILTDFNNVTTSTIAKQACVPLNFW